MAEEKQQKSTSKALQSTAGKAKDAAKLAKDVGRIAAGDLTAIKDVLMNKLVWEIVLVFAVTVSLIGMVIGASITGVLNYISESWSTNWEENKMDQAINSNGDLAKYKSTGWLFTLGNTVVDFVDDLFNGLTLDAILAGNGSSDNSQIEDVDIESAGKNPTQDDFKTTMEAIQGSAELTQALTDRLDMIKGRVMQRGLQIKKKVYSQYIDGKGSNYNEIAAVLQGQMDSAYQSGDSEKIYFYAGFDEALSEENIHFDTSAFELSDLQALKILAIFCIQHDCQLTEMDMWTLMDYCGWYDASYTGSLDDMPDSIYETVFESHLFGNDIGSVTAENTPILNWEFEPLEVPVWTGTCATQWYYEELAQIKEHNNNYLTIKEAGQDLGELIPWGVDASSDKTGTGYTLNDINLEQFEKLGKYKTFGIIDKLFYSAENNLTVYRKNYSSTDNYTQAEINALNSDKISNYWKKYIWACSKSTFNGTVARDENGNHSYTYSGSVPSDSYSLYADEETGIKTEVSVSYSLYLSGGNNYLTNDEYTFDGLSGKTKYKLYCKKCTATRKYDEAGALLSTSTTTSNQWVDSFTTFEDQMEAEAYELYLEVELSFKARSIDELAFDLLGIWPGSLKDTVQVVRTTGEGNLIGQSTLDESKYSYCLNGGTIDFTTIPELKVLIDSGMFPVSAYLPLKRSQSTSGTSTPLTVTKTMCEYGVTGSNSPITDPKDIPMSGWKTVSADGDTLVFDISGSMHYLVYMRWTYIAEVLNSDGTTTTTTEQYIFQIDEIRPGESSDSYIADTPIENGFLYANGHLGNDSMLLSWTDTVTQDGRSTWLSFSRMTGYQYETYVDMVMALCELLRVDYASWEPALERAEELGISRSGG